jgi:hypothetical protein
MFFTPAPLSSFAFRWSAVYSSDHVTRTIPLVPYCMACTQSFRAERGFHLLHTAQVNQVFLLPTININIEFVDVYVAIYFC